MESAINVRGNSVHEEPDRKSEDWDEVEMSYAFSQSRCVFPFCYNLSLVTNTIPTSAVETPKPKNEGSSRRTLDIDSDEDPFVDVVPVNVMPSPPPPKKEYLEDYENFTIKWVFNIC